MYNQCQTSTGYICLRCVYVCAHVCVYVCAHVCVKGEDWEEGTGDNIGKSTFF